MHVKFFTNQRVNGNGRTSMNFYRRFDDVLRLFSLSKTAKEKVEDVGLKKNSSIT